MDPQITVTSILVGSLLPNVIALVNQPRWSSQARGLVTFAICLVAGLIVTALTGGWVPINIATGIVGVLVASQVMYATLWKPSGIAPAIETLTSPGDDQSARSVR